jgi:uncharacterized protein (UPF0276 family)
MTPRFGLGFRSQHFAALREKPRGVDWLELLSDNYLGAGGRRRAQLEALRGEYPIALHGVSLGIANDAPPRPESLTALRELVGLVQPEFVSDHLCWTGIGNQSSHDLLPIAYTREVLELVSERVARVQDALGRRLLLENASAYVAFRGDELGEGDFFAALCQQTGCGVLLDVNNLFVNAANLGTNPLRTLNALRAEDVAYLHVAGHAALADVRIDTHGADVPEDVWALFAEVACRFPRAHVMLERDDAIPELPQLVGELDRARAIWVEASATEKRATVRARRPPTIHLPSLAAHGGAWAAQRRDFWERVVAKPLRFDHASRPGLAALLDAQRPVMATRGLRVYSDAYTANLRSALAANFPALARVLTPRDVTALADAYAAAHPPRSHDYVHYGSALADFIERFDFADSYAIARDALADVARLEQAQLEAQEAPDEPPGLAASALAELAPEEWPGARFRFAASLRLVSCSHDVAPAVRAVAVGERPPFPLSAPTAYLVARHDSAVVTETIDTRGAEVLSRMLRGARFADACLAAGGEDRAAPAVLALALACRAGAVLALRTERRAVRGSASAHPGVFVADAQRVQ